MQTPSERVDWLDEPLLSSKSTRSLNTGNAPLASACVLLESLPIYNLGVNI